MTSRARLAASLFALPLLALVAMPGCGAGPTAPEGDSPDERTGTSQAAWVPQQSGFYTFGGKTQNGTWPPSSTNNQLCMDIWGDNIAAGTVIDSTYCNGTLAQYFVLASYGNGQYAIQPGQNTSFCVTQFRDTSLRLEDCSHGATTAQLWTPGYDGTWRNVASGDCMDVPGGMNQSQAMTHQACTESQSQLLWAWGHHASLLFGNTTCLTYAGLVPAYQNYLSTCGGAYQSLYLGSDSSLGTSVPGSLNTCLAYSAGNGNGCSPPSPSNLQDVGYCTSYPQPAQNAWYMSPQYGRVAFVNYGAGQCLDQCGDNGTAYNPNGGWTQADLYTCGYGNLAQSWGLLFSP